MTREEIIKDAAAEHRDTVCCGFDDPIADAQEESFIVGAEWEHERLVEKACEWLNKYASDYAFSIYDEDDSCSISMNLVDDFKEAMEE